jgi:hypothetical protein
MTYYSELACPLHYFQVIPNQWLSHKTIGRRNRIIFDRLAGGQEDNFRPTPAPAAIIGIANAAAKRYLKRRSGLFAPARRASITHMRP